MSESIEERPDMMYRIDEDVVDTSVIILRYLNELRDKAQNNQPGARINEPGSRINEAITKEHDIALQKASDLQTIRDKELEYQRMKQIMEKQTVESTKPGNTFRSGLILSSEAPRKKNVRNRTTKKNDEYFGLIVSFCNCLWLSGE